MEKVKKKSSKTKLIFFIILGLLLASTLTYFGFQYFHEKNDQEILTKATKDYEKLFKKDHTPKDNLTINDVKKIENNIKNIQNDLDKKEKLQKDLNSLEAYLNLKITISKYYKDNIMLSTTTTTDINNLKNNGVNMEYIGEEIVENDNFVNKKFVITGTLNKYSRDEVKAIVENNGGTTSESVSKKTDVVIVGDSPGSKYDKALSLGIVIWDEEQTKNNIFNN